MNSDEERGPFDGVWNIVRFNWPMYAVSLVAGLAAFAWAVWVPKPRWLRFLALSGGCGTLGLSLNSLFVSHWIYDRSELYRWTWLPRAIDGKPARITNIHAGFDEVSPALARLYPESELTVLDFYDAERNTEPSIERARRWAPAAFPATRVSVERLPLASGSQDLLVMFLSAHEIRSVPERVTLLRESARILAPGGQVLLVEHLRDGANFLAFGPGFLHFHSDRTWRQAIDEAGLRVEKRFRITPFIHVLCCRSS